MLNSGLVSMQLMHVARAHGYDTNPMAGYDKDRIAEVFSWNKHSKNRVSRIKLYLTNERSVLVHLYMNQNQSFFL